MSDGIAVDHDTDPFPRTVRVRTVPWSIPHPRNLYDTDTVEFKVK
jgi:hypothetical protein